MTRQKKKQTGKMCFQLLFTMQRQYEKLPKCIASFYENITTQHTNITINNDTHVIT